MLSISPLSQSEVPPHTAEDRPGDKSLPDEPTAQSTDPGRSHQPTLNNPTMPEEIATRIRGEDEVERVEAANRKAMGMNSSQTSLPTTLQTQRPTEKGHDNEVPNIDPASSLSSHPSSLVSLEEASEVTNASAEAPQSDSDDSMDITQCHEVIDLTGDRPYNGPSLVPKEQPVKQEHDDAVISDPNSTPKQSQESPAKPDELEPVTVHKQPATKAKDASVNMDMMVLDAAPEDEFATSVLGDDDDFWKVDLEKRAEETEDTMALIREAGVNFRSTLPLNWPIDTPVAPAGDDVDMTDTVAADIDEANVTAARMLQELREYYEARRRTGTLDEVDDIDYRRACQAEQERMRHQEDNDLYQTTPEPGEESMFIPDANDTDQGLEDDISGDAPSGEGLNVRKQPDLTTIKKSTRKSGPKSSCSASKGGVLKGKISKSSGAKKRKEKPRTFQWPSFMRNSNDLIAAAQANQQNPHQPTFTSSKKDVALKQLILSMPEEQRKIHNIDKKEIEAASKKFTGAGVVKADGKGGWKLKGMKSSLRNYQLLGAAFMRTRERDRVAPGGFVADQMGLGKTVMTIANLVDSQKENAKLKNQATLVIAPSSILSQWLEEIDKHAEPERVKRVLLYRSQSQYKVRDPVVELGHNDVVITSYHEVCKSWPKNTPPLELCTDRAKEEWWTNERANNLGYLHLVSWNRIVLDEAQAIKNYQSRTSEAVCQLKGKHRWVVSGTPVQNKLEEFYPFFRFIGIPETGSYHAFKKNYCKKNSELALKRLQEMLNRYMLRRTHDDQLLGAPILILPNIRSTTKTLTFGHVEKAIYNVVKERFVLNIRAWSRAGSVEMKYQTIFVLLLRLRQVTAHCLLIQDTLKGLLDESDLRRLWELTEDDSKPEDYRLIRGLKEQLASTVPDSTQIPQENCVPGRIENRFRKALQSMKDDGRWAAIVRGTICAVCKEPPRDPHMTGCFHIYCYECLQNMSYPAKFGEKKDGYQCLASGCIARFDRVERCTKEYLATPGRGTPDSAGAARKKGSLVPEETNTNWLNLPGPIMQSAKTKATVSQIEHWLMEDEAMNRQKSKIIVFTQFRAMIEIMVRVCKERKWDCVDFHGGMKMDARDKAVKKFQEDKNCLILLAGLKAGGVGLNLTAGNRVIIIDLWWNQFVETQAFCRVYRIGQQREVEVVRFIVEDTIDEDIAAMQERKNEAIDQAIEAHYRPDNPSTKEMLALFDVDLERDGSGEPTAGLHDEPFIFTKDPYQNEQAD